MNTDLNSHTGLYSGLSGLQLPIPKYQYPSPFENASRLTYYGSFFNSIEINSSFYKIPQPATVAKWAGLVGDNFKFTFKLWKEITHTKHLLFKEEDVHTFFKSINAIGEKKACLLIQFPPSIGINHFPQVEKLLDCINEIDPAHKWKIAVEFRNKTWYQESVYELLKFYNAAVVIQDNVKSSTPMISQETDFIYVRFHGPSGNYRGSYSVDFLNEYAIYINEWIEEGKTVYVYFNNTMGDAFRNSGFLNSILQDSQECNNYLNN